MAKRKAKKVEPVFQTPDGCLWSDAEDLLDAATCNEYDGEVVVEYVPSGRKFKVVSPQDTEYTLQEVK